jgi:hypothetical protein
MIIINNIILYLILYNNFYNKKWILFCILSKIRKINKKNQKEKKFKFNLNTSHTNRSTCRTTLENTTTPISTLNSKFTHTQINR